LKNPCLPFTHFGRQYSIQSNEGKRWRWASKRNSSRNSGCRLMCWLSLRDNPFYAKLNELLKAGKFDAYVESLCAEYYKDGGRPGHSARRVLSHALDWLFRRHRSERGIAWRCADALSLRTFLGIPFHKTTPDHSSLSIIRHRFKLEAHQQVVHLDCGVACKA